MCSIRPAAPACFPLLAHIFSPVSWLFLLQVGDKVLLPMYGGNDIELGGEDYTIVRNDDILGVLE